MTTRSAFKNISLVLLTAIVAVLAYRYIYSLRYSSPANSAPVAAAVTKTGSADVYWCDSPSLLDKYACWVDAAGEGARTDLEAKGIAIGAEEVKLYKALEAMNLIQSVVSYARYTWFEAQLGASFPIPPVLQQEVCLSNGYGKCGNHSLLFLELMKRLGIQARSVQLWYKNPVSGERENHAAAEVFVEGKWRYFDITWGSLWLADKDNLMSILSIDDVLARRGIRVTADTNLWLNKAYRSVGEGRASDDPFMYLRGQLLDVTKNGGGVISIEFRDGHGFFLNLPSYVGKPQGADNLEMVLLPGESVAKSKPAKLSISGTSGCENSKIFVGENGYAVSVGDLAVSLKNGDKVGIRGTDNNCYAVIGDISLN